MILKEHTHCTFQPELDTPPRPLSTCPPFPWSRDFWEGRNCILNLVPCDNSFEREFAKFPDNARNVEAFAKLPQAFGFCIEYVDTAMNLRHYYPDFVAADAEGTHWLLETKGREDDDVPRKDAAAARWCEHSDILIKQTQTDSTWPDQRSDIINPTSRSTHPIHFCKF